jgi:hypothetical protein
MESFASLLSIPGSSEDPGTLRPGAVFEAAGKQADSQRDVEAKRREWRARCLSPFFLFASSLLVNLPCRTTPPHIFRIFRQTG